MLKFTQPVPHPVDAIDPMGAVRKAVAEMSAIEERFLATVREFNARQPEGGPSVYVLHNERLIAAPSNLASDPALCALAAEYGYRVIASPVLDIDLHTPDPK